MLSSVPCASYELGMFHTNPNTLSINTNHAKTHLCLTKTGNAKQTPPRNSMNFKIIFYQGNTKS